MNHETIVILDNGSAVGQLVSRATRDMGVYSVLAPFDVAQDKLMGYAPVGVIVIGGDENALEKAKAAGVPVMELEDAEIPSEQACKQFLYDQCGCHADWTTEAFVEEGIEAIRRQVGDKKVLLALSGGVDSSVCAAMISKAIGRRLTCIFVDTGLMRKNEGDQVEEIFTSRFDFNFIRVNAEARFLSKLAGVDDPEQKRKIIGAEFIRVFEEEASKLGQIEFLAQGTIYPDIIESGIGKNAVIKSHHNVGGLPANVGFDGLVEPLKDLFKDECRAVGTVLGLPDDMVWRQPFPGPGLGVRCLGEVTKEKLDVLRDADAIFREEVAKAGLDRSIWQYFAVMTNERAVGIKQAKRFYGRAVILRAVHSVDAMTASIAHIPYEVLERTSERIIREVDAVARVAYDITMKPPGTIEWE